jgi:hypothetical protein
VRRLAYEKADAGRSQLGVDTGSTVVRANLPQKWLKSSFGDPTSNAKSADNATEIHWTHSFEDAKIDVTFLTRVSGQNSGLLTVRKHKDSPKSQLPN